MLKKLLGGVLLCALVTTTGANVALAAPFPPYDPPIEARITVKWGNVLDTPIETRRVSFDGSLSVSEGRVMLVEVLKFETHDDKKDMITQKANPISWNSWIFGHWDGIAATIKADPSSLVTVKTDAGSVSVPYAKLLTAPHPTILSFGDGREIVIDVEKVVTNPFYLYTIWGGPVLTAADEVKAVVEIEDFAARLQSTQTAAEVKAVLDARPEKAPRPRANFSGALAIGNGAHGKLVETILFEPRQGDKITSQGENYVEWNSYIYNHFDGLFLKTQLDQEFPIDDTVTVKFSELGWRGEFSLAGLYVYGVEIKKVAVGDRTYLVAMVAVKAPFCDRGIHTASPSICDPVPVPVPVPIPLPEPVPVPIKPVLKSEPAMAKKAVTVDALRTVSVE